MSKVVIGLAVIGFFFNLNGFCHGGKMKGKGVGNQLPTERKKMLINNSQQHLHAISVAEARTRFGNTTIPDIDKGVQGNNMAKAVQVQLTNENIKQSFPLGFGVYFDENGDLIPISFMVHDKELVTNGNGFLSSKGDKSLNIHLRSILSLNELDRISTCKAWEDLWSYCYSDQSIGSGHHGINLYEVVQYLKNGSDCILLSDTRCPIEYLYLTANDLTCLTLGYHTFRSTNGRRAVTVIAFRINRPSTSIVAKTMVHHEMLLAKILPIIFPSRSTEPLPKRSGTIPVKDTKCAIVEVRKTENAFLDALNFIENCRLPSDNITGESSSRFSKILDPEVTIAIMEAPTIWTDAGNTTETIFVVFITDLIPSIDQAGESSSGKKSTTQEASESESKPALETRRYFSQTFIDEELNLFGGIRIGEISKTTVPETKTKLEFILGWVKNATTRSGLGLLYCDDSHEGPSLFTYYITLNTDASDSRNDTNIMKAFESDVRNIIHDVKHGGDLVNKASNAMFGNAKIPADVSNGSSSTSAKKSVFDDEDNEEMYIIPICTTLSLANLAQLSQDFDPRKICIEISHDITTSNEEDSCTVLIILSNPGTAAIEVAFRTLSLIAKFREKTPVVHHPKINLSIPRPHEVAGECIAYPMTGYLNGMVIQCFETYPLWVLMEAGDALMLGAALNLCYKAFYQNNKIFDNMSFGKFQTCLSQSSDNEYFTMFMDAGLQVDQQLHQGFCQFSCVSPAPYFPSDPTTCAATRFTAQLSAINFDWESNVFGFVEGYAAGVLVVPHEQRKWTAQSNRTVPNSLIQLISKDYDANKLPNNELLKLEKFTTLIQDNLAPHFLHIRKSTVFGISAVMRRQDNHQINASDWTVVRNAPPNLIAPSMENVEILGFCIIYGNTFESELIRLILLQAGHLDYEDSFLASTSFTIADPSSTEPGKMGLIYEPSYTACFRCFRTALCKPPNGFIEAVLSLLALAEQVQEGSELVNTQVSNSPSPLILTESEAKHSDRPTSFVQNNMDASSCRKELTQGCTLKRVVKDSRLGWTTVFLIYGPRDNYNHVSAGAVG